MDFADEISDYMWRNKLRQKEVAAKFGISVWTFRSWLKRKAKPPKICAHCVRRIMNNQNV